MREPRKVSGELEPSARPSAVGSGTCHRTGMSRACGAAWAGTAWLLLSDTPGFVTTVPGPASGPQSTGPTGTGSGRLTVHPRSPKFWAPGEGRQGHSQAGPGGSAGGCGQRGRDATRPGGHHREPDARATLLARHGGCSAFLQGRAASQPPLWVLIFQRWPARLGPDADEGIINRQCLRSPAGRSRQHGRRVNLGGSQSSTWPLSLRLHLSPELATGPGRRLLAKAPVSAAFL